MPLSLADPAVAEMLLCSDARVVARDVALCAAPCEVRPGAVPHASAGPTSGQRRECRTAGGCRLAGAARRVLMLRRSSTTTTAVATPTGTVAGRISATRKNTPLAEPSTVTSTAAVTCRALPARGGYTRSRTAERSAPAGARRRSADRPMKRRRILISIDAMLRKLLTRGPAVLVGLDAVGLAIGCVLRRRRGRAAGTLYCARLAPRVSRWSRGCR
jgi:hypothetical protein